LGPERRISGKEKARRGGTRRSGRKENNEQPSARIQLSGGGASGKAPGEKKNHEMLSFTAHARQGSERWRGESDIDYVDDTANALISQKAEYPRNLYEIIHIPIGAENQHAIYGHVYPPRLMWSRARSKDLRNASRSVWRFCVNNLSQTGALVAG
jgi:hypothetical protein